MNDFGNQSKLYALNVDFIPLSIHLFFSLTPAGFFLIPLNVSTCDSLISFCHSVLSFCTFCLTSVHLFIVQMFYVISFFFFFASHVRLEHLISSSFGALQISYIIICYHTPYFLIYSHSHCSVIYPSILPLGIYIIYM